VVGELRPALAAKGIRLLAWRELPAAEQARQPSSAVLPVLRHRH
jgi:hypothetical protein